MTTKMKTAAAMALATALSFGAVQAQAQVQAQDASEWRTVSPDNLLIIDTSKGRIVAELAPDVAPRHVERIRTLTNQGFYDGLKFHRVLPNFMAQTGDPQGTGQGGSELPDVAGEFTFRRGSGAPFAVVANSGAGMRGVYGVVPIVTQPDAQMFVTADFKVGAQGLFCPGVLGMARAGSPDSANSQFFLMTGQNDNLNGAYTVFGRILTGLDVVESLKPGSDAEDGKVTDPDVMTRVRLASGLPAGEQISARVLDPRSAAFAAKVEETRATVGSRFSICDVQPTAEVTGG